MCEGRQFGCLAFGTENSDVMVNTASCFGAKKVAVERKRKMERRYAGEWEIRLLIEIIEKHKDVLMDKRTDHAMITKKTEAWNRVTELFNSAAIGPRKSLQQLKRMWEHHRSK